MNGFRIPSWVVAGVIATMAILGLGYNLGAQVSKNDDRISRLEDAIRSLDFRLCRIELALRISPYQSCR